MPKGSQIQTDQSSRNKKKIFISHSSDDKMYANLIEDLLKDFGFTEEEIFYSSGTRSSEKVHPSEDIFYRLAEEIHDGDHFIFLLSNSFYQSAACTAEVGGVWLKEHEMKKDDSECSREWDTNENRTKPKSLYSIFCVPEFSASEIQQPLNRDLKAVGFNKEGLNLWVEEIIKPLLGEERCDQSKITETIRKIVPKYKKIEKQYGTIKILGSAFYCPPLNDKFIRSIFTSAEHDVFICDKDLQWLMDNDILEIIKTRLNEKKKIDIYILIYSSENPLFKVPSVREHAAEIQNILTSLDKILRLMEGKDTIESEEGKNKDGTAREELANHIHIKLNRSRQFVINGFAKDIDIKNTSEYGITSGATIYSTVYLNANDMRRNPVLKISKKYAKDRFNLYREHFQDIWKEEELLDVITLRREYEYLQAKYDEECTGGALILTIDKKNIGKSFIEEISYVTEYGRMFHPEDVKRLDTYQYSEQFNLILDIWSEEKTRLNNASEQIVFMFERIILGSAFNPLLKDAYYYRLLTAIINCDNLEANSLEMILQDALGFIVQYDKTAQLDEMNRTADKYLVIIQGLLNSEAGLVNKFGKDYKKKISMIIPIVISNYLGLSYYHAARIIKTSAALRDAKSVIDVYPKFTGILQVDSGKTDIKDVVEHLLNKAITEYETIIESLSKSHPYSDVISAYVHFNLGRVYNMLMGIEKSGKTKSASKTGKSDTGGAAGTLLIPYAERRKSAYITAIRKRSELSRDIAFPSAIRRYFALEELLARLDYVKIDSSETGMSKTEIDLLWEDIVKHPFDGVRLFETVKTRYAEYSCGREESHD